MARSGVAGVVAIAMMACVGCISGQTVRNVSQHIAWDYVAASAIESLASSQLARKYLPASLRGGEGPVDGEAAGAALDRMDADLATQARQWQSGPARILYDGDLKEITHRRVLRFDQVALLEKTGQVREGDDALLQPSTADRQLPAGFRRIVDEENQDRNALIDELSGQMVKEAERCGQRLTTEESRRVARDALRKNRSAAGP